VKKTFHFTIYPSPEQRIMFRGNVLNAAGYGAVLYYIKNYWRIRHYGDVNEYIEQARQAPGVIE
jgi:hypothetical protein